MNMFRTISTMATAAAALLAQPLLAQSQPSQSPAPTTAQAQQQPRLTLGPSDPWPGMKKLLIIADVQTGFHHDSINHAIGVIEKMGRESGAYATVIRTDSQLITKDRIVGTGTRYNGRPVNARNLDFFDAIFYLGSGAGALSDKQKADLLAFVKDDGKGFIAGHAATVAYYEWPEFTNMIGAFMESEWQVDTMPLMTTDPAFPGAGDFPATFSYNDQFPVMRAPFSSKDAHVIIRLDPRKMTAAQLAKRPDGDFPLVWAKNYGKGRVYNNTIAHREEVWDDPKFQAMMLGGIKWALGIVDADVKPGNSKVPAFTPPATEAK